MRIPPPNTSSTHYLTPKELSHVPLRVLNCTNARKRLQLSCKNVVKLIQAIMLVSLPATTGQASSKQLITSFRLALIFPPGLDLICAFYGCLYLGAIPITIRPPHPQNLITTLPTVRMIVDVSKSGIVLSIQSIIKLLKSREAAASIDPKSWPLILDIDDNPKRKLTSKSDKASMLDDKPYTYF